MAASDPLASRRVGGEQGEGAETEGEKDDVEHECLRIGFVILNP